MAKGGASPAAYYELDDKIDAGIKARVEKPAADILAGNSVIAINDEKPTCIYQIQCSALPILSTWIIIEMETPLVTGLYLREQAMKVFNPEGAAQGSKIPIERPAVEMAAARQRGRAQATGQGHWTP